MSESTTPDPKEKAPMQLVLAPTRRRKPFLKHKYAETITIREIDKDRPTPRIIKIAATLDSAKIRARILVTKAIDRIERRFDMMADADAQMTPKEYKELSEALEKLYGMLNESFGVSEPVSKSGNPVNNGIIINSTNTPAGELAEIMKRATAKAVVKEAPPIDIPNDTGADQENPKGDGQ